MPKPKSAYIRFRTTKARERFLKLLVKEMNINRNSDEKITLSDLVDSIIQYFMMSYTLGEFRKPLPEIRKEFISFMEGFNKKKMDLKKTNRVSP